jgi:hypothetical protein
MASSLLISPPPEAYHYWPSGDYIIKGLQKRAQRFIFYHQSWTPFENTKLDRLKAALSEQKIALPPAWDDTVLLRLMYGTGWKTRKSVEAVLKHLDWISQSPPDKDIETLRLQPLLESGCLYIHGRDCRYRPCLVMCYPKFDFRRYTIDDYLPLVRYLLDLVIAEMMIPGQVENWVTITDMGKMGLTDLPMGQLKRIIEVLQDNYKCRLGFNVIVNAPTSVNIIWAIVKKFMDKDVVEKMSITGKPTDPLLFRHFSPSQIEEKYGGSAANLTLYWPPVFPPPPFEPANMSPGSLLSERSSYESFHPEVKGINEDLYAVEEVEDRKEIDDEGGISHISDIQEPIEYTQKEEAIPVLIQSKEPQEAPAPTELQISPPVAFHSIEEAPEGSSDLPAPLERNRYSEVSSEKVEIDEPVKASWGCCGIQRCQKTSVCVVF